MQLILISVSTFILIFNTQPQDTHLPLAPTALRGPWTAGRDTCCTVGPVATLPSCFLSSSSSCMEILEAVAGALKLGVLLAAAAAASSALSLAFCCKYCRV